jgi:hypothetical protein
MRHEHRTLPALIALGVLLGAGLALATPAGHPAHDRRPAPGVTRSASPSPSATVSPTSSPSASASASTADAHAARCAHRAASPGWAVGHPPLAHAIHVLLSSCGRTRGNGLRTAIEHVRQSAERHTGSTQVHAGGTGDAHRREPGTHETGVAATAPRPATARTSLQGRGRAGRIRGTAARPAITPPGAGERRDVPGRAR